MTDRTPFFLLLGMFASVLLAIGLAMMKSRGSALPAARGARIFGAIRHWFGDPVWIGGLALQTMGYVIYLIALSGAPVSLLAVTMQGGIGLFVVVAVGFLGERANPREWFGIGGIVSAILLLGLSLPGGATASVLDSSRLVVLSFAAVIVALITFLAERSHPAGVASAIVAGLAFGMGSLYAKALVGVLPAATAPALAISLIATPWAWLAVAANVGGLVMLQNSFHAARGIVVMPISSACSNLVPILGGIVAFGEGLPAAGGPAALRLSAFALTIVAGGLLATARD